MSEEFTKVKITIPIPFDRPNKNGSVFTEKAVEDAVSSLQKNLPIVSGYDGLDRKVIGATTGDSHIVTWDFDNQVCKVTVDGVVFTGGAEIVVNEIEDGKISDFRIVSIGLTT